MKLLYFGAYNLHYPRNSILRNGLIEHGWQILICRCDININPLIQNWFLLINYLKLHQKNFNVIYLAERGQNVAILAWLISKLTGKPLVVDFLYSRYDTQTEKKVVIKNSFSAKVLWILDWISLHIGDLIVCDTKSHIEFYANEFRLNPKKAIAIYLGADLNIYKPTAAPLNSKTKIIFWGSYTPSHGVDTIIRTAKLTQCLNLEYVLIGYGPTYQNSIQLANELSSGNITFYPWMSQDELALIISQADIVIGAVGKTQKSMRSICFKEFQGCAMKKPVITAETPAIKEVFTDRKNIILCQAANSFSLRDAIIELINDKNLTRKISDGGYNLILDYFSHIKVSGVLSNHLIELLESGNDL